MRIQKIWEALYTVGRKIKCYYSSRKKGGKSLKILNSINICQATPLDSQKSALDPLKLKLQVISPKVGDQN